MPIGYNHIESQGFTQIVNRINSISPMNKVV